MRAIGRHSTRSKHPRGLVGDAYMCRELLDNELLLDPTEGVNYFKNTLKKYFLKGTTNVYLYRLLSYAPRYAPVTRASCSTCNRPGSKRKKNCPELASCRSTACLSTSTACRQHTGRDSTQCQSHCTASSELSDQLRERLISALRNISIENCS